MRRKRGAPPEHGLPSHGTEHTPGGHDADDQPPDGHPNKKEE
jgi:hypothetical protein